MENISNTASVQAERVEKVYSNSGMYKVIIIFLVLFISIFVLLTIGVIKRLPYIPEDVASVILDTVVCDSCKMDEEEFDSQELLQNEGWALYQYPEYGFSVELPSYTYFNSDVEEQSIMYGYRWKIEAYDLENTNLEEIMLSSNKSNILPNLSKVVNISFEPTTPFPQEILENFACSGDCLNYSYISIKFFDNTERLNLEEIDDTLQSDYCSGDETVYTSEMTTFNGREALDYECSEIMSTESGTVLLSEGYIVKISYSLISDQDEPAIQVEKIFDSMKFD